MAANEPGQIFSFYSFKGGVGRSMALANVATLLARAGSSVLVVDWDLEAPGLHKYFNRFDSGIDSQILSKPGIVDLLSGLQSKSWPNWRDAVVNISLAAKGGPVKLDFISAGRVGLEYSNRFQKIDWQKLYDDLELGRFLENLRQEWKNEYAYVLLDSRTGVTDIGDVCTVLLPDALVAFFVTNEQNLDGVQSIINRAHFVLQKLPTDRGRLVTVPVLARDEVYNEYRRAQLWRQKSAEKFAPALVDWLPKSVSATSYFQKMFIPYVTHWSFGESLPVLENEEEIENPASISAAYSRLAAIIRGGLDWGPLATGEDPLAIEILKAEKTRLEQTVGGARRFAYIAGITGAIIAAAAIGISVVFTMYQDRRIAEERRLLAERAHSTAIAGTRTDPVQIDQLLAVLKNAERSTAEAAKQQQRILEEQLAAAQRDRKRAEDQLAAMRDTIAAAEGKLAASNDQIREMQRQNSELLERIAKRIDEHPRAPRSLEKDETPSKKKPE